MLLLDISISIFEFYIFITFYRIIFYKKDIFKENKKAWYLYTIVAFIFLVIGAAIIRHIIYAPPLVLMLYTFGFLICLSYMYQTKIADRVFYSCILILLGFGSELLAGFYYIGFMDNLLPTISAIDNSYVFASVCSKIILFLLSRCISIFYRKDKKTIPLTYWIVLALVPIVSVFELHAVALCATDASSIISSNPMLIVPGILIVNILVFAIYDIVSFQYEQSIQKERELTFLESTQKRYETLVEHGQAMAALIHDSNKHLSTIGILIKNNEINNCLDYIDELGIKYSQSISYEKILPANQALSIVLDAKLKEAISYGIEVEYRVGISHKIPLPDTDLCMVFVNAFDNAIKACNEYAGDKKILFEIHQTYNRLIILIQNTSMPVHIESNGLCKTTKEDKHKHGFGLANIRNIVNAFGGNIQLTYKENEFSLKILLFL